MCFLTSAACQEQCEYTAMENAVCKDNRARGNFSSGANRTGRFAGRLIQLQNLLKIMEDLAEAHGLVRSGNYDASGTFI